ncbi:MAG: T9SS type A sorting domain-containing protein [Bacteroidota bacterium]|nr:T9SS type A sorting domain-containing protein [Bacteroidota bacterium]
MKKLYSFGIACLMIFGSISETSAQCTGSRYHDFIFPSNPTVVSNIQYGMNTKENGTNQNLMMDIYQPTGDVSTSRALIIMAHGGSFIGGSKTGTDVVPLCKDLAKLGYVVASIEYRVGMNNFPFPGPDSSDATEAVMRAVHDGRAAVRYFRKNASTGGNLYKIDTTNIYFAGVSAGGFMALQMAYLDQLSEFPTYIDTLQPGLLGGVQGMSGNQGYSSEVKAIVNICGALGDTAWIQPGDEPVLSFHGTNDGTVPYGSDTIVLVGTYPLLEVDGSYSVNERVDQLGIINCFETHEGKDHVPHTNNANDYDTTLVITRNFLEHFTCGVALQCNYTTAPLVGISEYASDKNFTIFPNPAGTMATIDLSEFENQSVSLELFDMFGRKVKSIGSVKGQTFTLERENLTSGIYFLSISTTENTYSKKIIFE